MKIYVATKWENRPRAQEIAAQLEAAGHTITCRWWENDQITPAQAMADFDGVTYADALVVIAEQDARYAGTYVEFGIALRSVIPIYIIGNAWDHCIFMQMPHIQRGIETLLQATSLYSS